MLGRRRAVRGKGLCAVEGRFLTPSPARETCKQSRTAGLYRLGTPFPAASHPLRSSRSNPLPWAGTPSTRPGCSKPHPTWPWNTSRGGASTTSLDDLFQCLTTLIVKNLILISNLNLPTFSLKPLPLVLSPHALAPFTCWKAARRSPRSLLQAEQPQLSQPVFVGEVLQPSGHLHGPPLDLLQQLHVLLMLRPPELHAVLQMGSHKSGVEGQNHLPQPAGHASFDAAQDTVGFLGCKCTLPGHVELLINQHPHVLLLRAALNPFSAQPVFVLGIALTHVQDLALGFVELHEVHTGPPLKPVRVPLDGIPPLQHVDCTTQLGVVGKLAEGALNATVHVADKDVKQHRSQYRPLRNATRHWSPLGYRAVDRNSLSVTIQPIPYPPSGPSVKSTSLQFRDKDVVWDSVRCFAQVQSVGTSPDCHNFSNMMDSGLASPVPSGPADASHQVL
ncbi:hypothetical protein QYF61_019187 [Mycteria americana]|uniref:Uncharacterized protein n=1 Tax=Mycteria americana TaxID=33587 RepID=A0AAN7NH49_MYCAM|nr:hypothetical protein QYF61_019187 [Mycteria americana]